MDTTARVTTGGTEVKVQRQAWRGYTQTRLIIKKDGDKKNILGLYMSMIDPHEKI